MVDYHILQQFATFYQTGTLRETAEKLHISQPTWTRNMQKCNIMRIMKRWHKWWHKSIGHRRLNHEAISKIREYMGYSTLEAEHRGIWSTLRFGPC